MTAKEKDDTALEPTADKAPELDASAKSAIVSAIHNLDKGDPKHYNKRGEPRVEALTEMCGFKVTRADVVEVWGERNDLETDESAPPVDPVKQEQQSEFSRQLALGPESDPIKCMKMFEFLMSGSRNAVLKLILNEWRTSRNEAIELDKRLRARGQY